MASTSGEATDPTDADTISIQNLQLPFGILALDVWGKAKEQPGLVSVTVGLRDGFQSAAEHDALDASTIHYGELAKRIRGGCTARQPVGELIATVGQVVQDMADKDGRSIVASTAVALDLPKASMFGDGVTFRAATFYDEHGRQTADPHWAVTVRNVKIMTMIGVNSYERTAKQPIVATCTWHITSRAQAAAPALEKAVYRFEQTLVQVQCGGAQACQISSSAPRERERELTERGRRYKTRPSRRSSPWPTSRSSACKVSSRTPC